MKVVVQLLCTVLTLSVLTSMAIVDGDFTGTWSYVVTDTPNGTYKGEMTIEKDGAVYSGFLMVDGQKITLKNVKVAEKQLSYNLYVEGSYVTIKLKYEGAILKGGAYVEGELFPMTAEVKAE